MIFINSFSFGVLRGLVYIRCYFFYFIYLFLVYYVGYQVDTIEAKVRMDSIKIEFNGITFQMRYTASFLTETTIKLQSHNDSDQEFILKQVNEKKKF